MSVNTPLSKKEIECLCLAAQDYSTKAASKKLHRTIDTVKRHRSTLLQKLGCHTMAGAVMLGIKMRLFDEFSVDDK